MLVYAGTYEGFVLNLTANESKINLVGGSHLSEVQYS